MIISNSSNNSSKPLTILGCIKILGIILELVSLRMEEPILLFEIGQNKRLKKFPRVVNKCMYETIKNYDEFDFIVMDYIENEDEFKESVKDTFLNNIKKEKYLLLIIFFMHVVHIFHLVLILQLF